MDHPTYRRMAAVHIQHDIEIGEAELRCAQRKLNATSKPLIQIFDVGAGHPGMNKSRCWNNAASNACDPPKLKSFQRFTNPPPPRVTPQSRPLVSAHTGLSTRAGDLLAAILEPMIAMTSPRLEDLSTGEVIAQIDETGDYLRENRINDASIGSLDVSALYPSIPHEQGAREVEKFVMNTDGVKLDGFNTRAAQVFIASNLTEQQIKDEGIQHLIPQRVHKKGNRPSTTTDELTRMETTKYNNTDNNNMTNNKRSKMGGQTYFQQ